MKSIATFEKIIVRKTRKMRTTVLGGLILALPFWTAACGQKPSNSKVDVTSVANTSVKRQKIGNCWLYATASWAESLHLTATGETVNISETYWTYVDWYEKILNSSTKEIQTGGTWEMASQLITKYGYMYEADFAPGEEKVEISKKQENAEDAINDALSTGSLKNPRSRTAANVIAALNKAFHVKYNSVQKKIHPANTLVVGRDTAGHAYGLNALVAGASTDHAWKSVSYPRIYGKGAEPTPAIVAERKALIVRVMKALNDHQPVMMSVMVDFNAINPVPYATFDLPTYLAEDEMGDQGGHMVILDDYTVDNAPGFGYIGEGEVSTPMKEAALKGDLAYLKAKNSWGTKRPKRGLTDGYTAFNANYLNATMPWQATEDDDDINHARWYTALTGFVLPPWY